MAWPVAVIEKEEMKKSRFPKGWDEKRVKRVLAHYEKQTEEEALAEDKAAYEDKSQAIYNRDSCSVGLSR